MKEVRNMSNRRIATIQAFCVDTNHKLVEIKECEYNKLVKSEEMLKDMIEKKLIQGDLMPRDALYDGLLPPEKSPDLRSANTCKPNLLIAYKNKERAK